MIVQFSDRNAEHIISMLTKHNKHNYDHHIEFITLYNTIVFYL